MIQNKLEKNDNYILNAIVNHALYNYENYKKRIKKNNFTIEDVITQISYETYKKEYDKKKINKIDKFKYNVIKNFLRGKSYKNKITYALDRLSYEQDKVAQQFYEMFDDNNYEK